MGPGGYPPQFGMYGPPQGGFGFQFAPGEMPLYNQAGYDIYTQGPPPSTGSRRSGEPMQRKKSLCGPMTEEDRGELLSRRSFRNPPSEAGQSTGKIARSGSIYSRGSRPSSLSRGMSARDLAQEVFLTNMEEKEELKMYYGDMAEREEAFEHRGARAVGTHREVSGKDVAQPRRLQRRGKMGYGGVTSHRTTVMRNGGRWGNMELRRRSSTASSRDLEPDWMAPMPVPMMPEPVIMPEPVRVMSQMDMSIYDDGDVFKDRSSQSSK
ncbi:uncharacterized protein TM35_000232230 [Trypanosoma theileri]|uniref:Uncharacterized protein n=1 Tax=Trypanosoma theileri TaxID=67003 RepID=A0A1X0NRB6_9TRYP|nr:uncharacterized protein TM35_000232230 [Trypanosoma theileri]ORC87252.1 hypothetical protein TM35_000232230 [Trypanosoma theileri]